jgi:uncharacterized membrane protein
MMIDDIALARAIHVLAVVHWIGGVAAVTTIVLPRARKLADATAAIDVFATFERRFAPQARVSIGLAGLSGIYMLYRLDAWDRLRSLAFWWLDIMVVVWLVFALMVYVLEPLGIDRRFHDLALRDRDRALALMIRLHALALGLAALAIAAGVMGAHGAL